MEIITKTIKTFDDFDFNNFEKFCIKNNLPYCIWYEPIVRIEWYSNNRNHTYGSWNSIQHGTFSILLPDEEGCIFTKEFKYKFYLS